MLRPCTEQEFRKYADPVYEIARDPSRSGYPSYSDGIKTKEMFLERSGKAFLRDTEEILLFEYEGVVEGWLHYYCIPEDRYLQPVSFNVAEHTEEALREFLAFAEEKFRGYELFLGYGKENRKAVSFLAENGFICIEEDFNNTAFLEQYAPQALSAAIVRVDRENYELFRTIHSRIEGDMYWNSDRICEDLENWVVFVEMKAGEPVGAVYYMDVNDGWFEIFGIDGRDDPFDPAVFRDLLIAALNDAKERGGKWMTFFSEAEGQRIVQEVGFVCAGEYVCYKKRMG